MWQTLLESASGIVKCDRLYYKLLQALQLVTDCYYKVRQVVQSVTDFIRKCVRYCKVWQTLLQSASGITKCDNYYKVRRNKETKIWWWLIDEITSSNSLSNFFFDLIRVFQPDWTPECYAAMKMLALFEIQLFSNFPQSRSFTKLIKSNPGRKVLLD